MSEEILKALMQLFAIITKQDDGSTEDERKFVELFLRQQLNAEIIPQYLALFDEFLGVGGPTIGEDGEEIVKKKKLTSVKDSVKTLSICKKINKTLTQKQKIIVLIRLFELIGADKTGAEALTLRMEIIDTVATVFNIEELEYTSIEKFCKAFDTDILESCDNMMLISSKIFVEIQAKSIQREIDGFVALLHLSSESMYFLKYVGTGNVILNGLPVSNNQVYLFAYGSSIKMPIGEQIYYSDINAKFLSDQDIQKLSFEAKNISYKFPAGNYGLLNINISEGPGNLIAIMGGSGAGKTTLLTVLSGLNKPSEGTIKINEVDIFKESKKVEGVIGYVAQDDVLFEELTVFENLFYNAQLCFKDKSETELNVAVVRTLKNLGLYEIRELKVGNVLNKKISGGQRKRLNIALELIREPAVMFLDEPTSGLSSRDSENVMDLLKELTLKGKLIFVVIHQPSSDIYKMFDKVVILDVGGYQIYYGNPVNAVSYFKKITNQINAEEGQCYHCGNVNPEQIFNTIEAKVVDEYGNLTEKRKISPKIWNQYFGENIKIDSIDAVNDAPPKTLNLPNKIKQFIVFTKRDFLSKASNLQYMLINLLEAPVLAMVLAFIIRYTDDQDGQYFYGQNENIPAYLFMAVIVALFMGLTVSAEEIIRDAKILKREKFLNLSRSSYLISKIGILFLLSAVQTFFFSLIGNLILGIQDMTIAYWIMLFSLSCHANLIGLNISNTFNSAVTIYILIPLLLIPQMILSGAIFSFDKLNKFISNKDQVPIVADIMASRWAFEGLAVKQYIDNKYQKVFYDYELKECFHDFRNVYWYKEMLSLANETKTAIENKNVNIVERNKLTLKNELIKEIKLLPKGTIEVNELKQSFEKFDNQSLEKILAVVTAIKNYHSEEYNIINLRKDQLLSKYNETPQKIAIFKEVKKKYFNESLSDIVRNISTKNRVLTYNNKIIQVVDPIYNIPEKTLNPINYRSHLYAPKKHFLIKTFDTFSLNIIIIWIMSFVLYLCLYFELFKKILEYGERIFVRIEKKISSKATDYKKNKLMLKNKV